MSDATALLQEVYVSGGYTNAQGAAAMKTRKNLEGAGDLLLCLGCDTNELLGATIFLHPNSPLQQLAQNS